MTWDIPYDDALRKTTVREWHPYRKGRWVLWCTNPPNPIPSFDKVLVAASRGPGIFGVTLRNPGYGISIEDIVSEHSYTEAARKIQ